MKKTIAFIISLVLLLNSVSIPGLASANVLKVSYEPLKYTFDTELENALIDMIDPAISAVDYLKYKEYENVHPRLFIDSTEVDYIKENADEGEAYYYLYSRMVSRADSVLTKKLPGWPADGKNTTSLHRAVGDNLAVLAVAYLLTGDSKYYTGIAAGNYSIKSAIYETCETYPSWGVEQYNNDLVFSHITVGLSLVWDYCQDILTDADKAIIVNTIKERMEYALEKSNSNYGHNHSHINRVALSIIGLSMFEELDNVDSWMEENLHFISLAVKTFSPDGAYHEGIMYQDYALQFILPFVDLAKKFHNVDLISESEHFKNYKYFLAGTSSSNGVSNLSVPFNNSKKSHVAGRVSAHASFLADWFSDKEYQSIADWFMKKETLNSNDNIWYEILLSNPLKTYDYDFTADYPLTQYFENSEILTVRNDWGYTSPMFSAKCNPPLGHLLTTQNTGLKIGSGHAEPDANHFTLLGFDGEYLFYDDIDFGYENTVTGQHNTLLIDDEGQKGDGEAQFMGNIVYNYMDGFSENPHFEKITETDEYVYAVGSAASAYPEEAGVEKFNRHFIYFKSGSLVVFDEILLENEKEMTIRYLPFDQNISRSGTTFTSRASKNTMKMYSLNVDDSVTIDANLKTLVTNFTTGETVSKKTIDYIKNGKEWINAVGISFVKSGNNPDEITLVKDKGLYLLSVGDEEFYIDLDDMIISKNKTITPFDLVPSEYNSIAYSVKEVPTSAISKSNLVYAKTDFATGKIETAGIAKFDLTDLSGYEYGVNLTVQAVIYSSNHDAVDFDVYYVPDSSWTQDGMQSDITTTPGYVKGDTDSFTLENFEYVGSGTVTGQIVGATYNYDYFTFNVSDYVLKSLSDNAVSFFFVARKNENSSGTNDPQIRLDFKHVRGSMHLNNVIPDPTLKEIKVNGTDLSEFNSGKYNYEIYVNDGQEFPEITAVPTESQTKVSIEASGTVPGYAIITTEAADGSSDKYSVRVKNIAQKTGDYIKNKLPIIEYTVSDDNKVTAVVNKASIPDLEEANFIFTGKNASILKEIKSAYYEKDSSSPDYTFENVYDKIKTYIWNSYSSGKILLNSAEYNSVNAGIEKIYLNGEEFSRYSDTQNEYTYTLGANSLYYPTVDVVTKDSSSKVDITYPKAFPGKLSIKVTSSGGVENIVYINFERETEKVSDYIINCDGGLEGTITKITDLNSKDYYGFAGDSTYYLEDIPNELLGAYTLSYPREAYNQASTAPGYHSFKINRSATIYILAKLNKVDWIDSSYEKVTFPDNPLFGWYYEKASSEANLHQTFQTLYKKRVEVSEFSEEEFTVNMPGIKSWYTIMVKFD